MAGFETLEQAIQLGEAYAPITPEETKFEGEWDDATALGIVLADIDTSLAFDAAKNFVTRIELAETLIRGYVRIRPWPNTDKPRSALSMPLTMEVIEKLMPPIWLSIWGTGKDPFLVKPIGKTTPEAAHAWQNILRWAVRESNFKEGTRLTLKNALTYGNGVGFDGWKVTKIDQRKYKRDDQGKIVRDTSLPPIEIAKPTYECANLRNIVFDSSLADQDVRNGRFIAKRIMISAYDLQEMAKDDTYKNIPTEEQLRQILANKEEIPKNSMQLLHPNETREFQSMDDKIAPSKDPLQTPLELIEYKTCDRIITILQRQIVIRNDENERHELGAYSCAFIDVLNSFYGFGVTHLLGHEQRFQQGVLNTSVDSLALNLNPSFQQIKGLGNTGQNITIAPGKVTTVESELKPLVVADVQKIAQSAIEMSEVRAYRRVGAEGATNAPTQALRTGTGVNAFQGEITQRLQYFIEQFLNLIFVPVLQSFVVHCSENLTPEQFNRILSEMDGKAFEGDILDVYNADMKIDIVSGIRLSSRQAASQAAPILLNAMGNVALQQSLQIQGRKFDYARFTEDWFELLGIDWDQYFVPMTKEDLERVKDQNQAMQRGAADAQKIQLQHSADLDSIDAKAAAQGQLAVLRSMVKQGEAKGLQALEPQEQPGPIGTKEE